MNKKKMVRIVALVLAFFLVFVSVLSAVMALAEEETPHPLYEMHMSLMENEQAVYVTQQVSFTNDTGRRLKDVFFQLPANALRRQATAPFESEEMSDAYPAGFAPGGVNFISILVNGQTCDWGVQGESESVLRVACELAPGEAAKIQFVYYVLLPRANGTLGAGEHSWRLSGFYPVLCVFDPGMDSFSVTAVSALGNTLFSQTSDYTVTLEMPEAYTALMSGVQTEEQVIDHRKVWRMEGKCLRTMALVVGKNLSQRQKTTASGVTLRAAAPSASSAKTLLSEAEKIMAQYEAWFGPYPFEELDIAQCEALRGASETGLVEVPEGLKKDELREEIARQIARQWFGGSVGSHPVYEPWLSETLSEYAMLLYVEASQGYAEYLKRLNARAVPALKVTMPGGLTVDGALDRFSSRSDYETVVRGRGIAVMHELRELIGKDALLDTLGLYTAHNRLGIASVGDFAAALDETAGRRLDEYLVGQLQTISEYAGKDVKPYE